MPRFIALPVAQGDAFYLERLDFTVLVDGGRSRTTLLAIFQTVTDADGVNVAICTHNDADHANGVLGFLEAGLRCDEVWLPGRWLGALPDLLKPFVNVFVELIEDVAHSQVPSNSEELSSDLSPLEAYAEGLPLARDEPPLGDDGPFLPRDGWPDPHLAMLERAEPWQVAPWDGWRPDYWPFVAPVYLQLGLNGVRLLWSAIDAAARIRAIAVEAFHRGIPVRWFEFDARSPSGGVPALVPVNARMVAKVRPRVGSLLDFLALTVSNKESLVFWSPRTDQHPGVLFTADSDLATIQLPPQLRGAISTAPHHGSETNASAYAAVAAADPSSTITWVRSDGRYRNRPGRTYLALSSRRLCTLCRHGVGTSSSKQAVHLFSRGTAWARHRTTNSCTCR